MRCHQQQLTNDTSTGEASEGNRYSLSFPFYPLFTLQFKSVNLVSRGMKYVRNIICFSWKRLLFAPIHRETHCARVSLVNWIVHCVQCALCVRWCSRYREQKERERAGESVSPVHGAVRKVLKIFDSERCICAKVFTLSFSVYLFACQWNHLRVRCVFFVKSFLNKCYLRRGRGRESNVRESECTCIGQWVARSPSFADEERKRERRLIWRCHHKCKYMMMRTHARCKEEVSCAVKRILTESMRRTPTQIVALNSGTTNIPEAHLLASQWSQWLRQSTLMTAGHILISVYSDRSQLSKEHQMHLKRTTGVFNGRWWHWNISCPLTHRDTLQIYPSLWAVWQAYSQRRTSHAPRDTHGYTAHILHNEMRNFTNLITFTVISLEWNF